MNKKQSSYIYVLFAVLLWASTPAVGKLLVQDITNIQLMFYSFMFSIGTLFFIVLVQGKLSLLKTYSPKDYLRMAVMGVLGCYLYSIFFFGALMYAPAQEVFIVNYLWPVMVVVFASFTLGERFHFLKILGVVLGFLGVYVVVSQGDLLSFSFIHPQADLLAALGAVSYGLFSVLGKKYSYEKFTSMLVFYAVGFLLVSLTVGFFSHIPALTFTQLLRVLWVGVFTNTFAFIFWFKALEYGDTSVMANIIFLTPFLSLIYIYMLLGEPILFSSFVGLLVIVSGILLQSLRKKENIVNDTNN